MTEKVVLDVRGPIAVITNNRPEKRNAFDDEMDVRLFEILSELKERRDVRAIIWRGEGPVWSAGRDVSVIGTNTTTLSHHELMTRGHQGILQLFDLDVPSIAASMAGPSEGPSSGHCFATCASRPKARGSSSPN